MTVGIYKIENRINGKVYIGQSVHIERRFNEHRASTKSIIGQAISKYGKENFIFSILEECEPNELLEKEVNYIRKYESIIPNGYNILLEADGEETHFIFIDRSDVLSIQNYLIENKISIPEIADLFEISIRTIYYINSGKSHYQKDLIYPLRPVLNYDTKHCIICGNPLNTGSKYCSTECAAIAQRHTERPSKEVLLQEVAENGFTQTGKKYKVSGNAIKSWCKGYGLPFLLNDIKKEYGNFISKKEVNTYEHLKKPIIVFLNKEKYEFQTTYEFADYLITIGKTKAEKKVVVAGIRRVLTKQRKTYLGYDITYK